MTRWFVLLIWLLPFLSVAHAAPQNPFRVEAQDLTLAPGASGKASLTLVIPPAFHVFRDMMEVKVHFSAT